jgi:hypothetical protein
MIRLLLVILSLTAASPEAESQVDRVSSFRDIVWGSSLDSVIVNGATLDFTKVKESDFENAYELFNDKLAIGNVGLKKIEYIFNEDNRFYKVFLQGQKDQTEEMAFILEFKFGSADNQWNVEDIEYRQWIIADVTFTLAEHRYHNFDLVIESDWQSAEAYRKNTSVEDF